MSDFYGEFKDRSIFFHEIHLTLTLVPNLIWSSGAALDQDRLWVLRIAQGITTSSTKHCEDGQVWSSCPHATVISVAVAGPLLLQKQQSVKFHRCSVLTGCCSLYLLDLSIRLLSREDVVKCKIQNHDFW